jgi:hypothetical protein
MSIQLTPLERKVAVMTKGYNRTDEAKRAFLREIFYLLYSYVEDDKKISDFYKILDRPIAEIPQLIIQEIFPYLERHHISRLNYYLERINDWNLYCNHDYRFMYFCGKPNGHSGKHVDDGLSWETDSPDKVEERKNELKRRILAN